MIDIAWCRHTSSQTNRCLWSGEDASCSQRSYRYVQRGRVVTGAGRRFAGKSPARGAARRFGQKERHRRQSVAELAPAAHHLPAASSESLTSLVAVVH